ncbi:MAG: glycosyl transferase family 2 [Microgenomates group bacterium Gr01-1014_93]|nr:MAG: glycosyl transferase family 2 [Microgenomates group bacterium Gr01-1014_93]
MKTQSSLVTIGMPLLNEGRYLSKALDSLLNQSFSDFEIIISDNASTDETAEIAKNYAKKDQRIRYYRTDSRVGGRENFNRLFQLSSGKYFMWASGHDLWHKDFQNTQKALGRVL